MAISEVYVGNAVTVTTTELSMVSGTTVLQSDTNDGIYQIFIDFSTMAAGDEYLVQVKERTTATSTQRVVWAASVAGAQPSLFVSPTLILLHGWDATLDKQTGTDRAITWSIRRVA